MECESVEQIINDNSDLPTNSDETQLTLQDYFKNIVEKKPVEFDVKILYDILRKDLQVNLYYLKARLKFVMPYMLVHFIKSWPGWQKNNNYVNKQISLESWFKKFKEYLVFKINYLIKNDFDKVDKAIKAIPVEERVSIKIDNSTQTDVPPDKFVAPYTIVIEGGPKILNCLRFYETLKGNVIIKQYNTNSAFQQLSTKQLLNWPYVELQFSSKELNFKRKNMHEFKRYLRLSNDTITFQKVGGFIEEVDIINEQLDRSAYTINVLKQYCGTYMKLLNKHQQLMEISNEYIGDIKVIFDEFISDIVDINLDSMATNTSVLFNIGGYTYARNKSLRSSGKGVSCTESITPKMLVSLLNYSGIEDKNSKTPFQGLQNAIDSNDKDFIKQYLPTLIYSCTYCQEQYNEKVNLLTHFNMSHSMEQPIICFKCKQEIDMGKVCENRWNHQCNDGT